MIYTFSNAIRRNCGALLRYRCYKKNISTIPVRHHSYEGDGKTTISILNKDTSQLMIDSYSQIGFRLNNGLYVLGPMAIFPRTVLSWNVGSAEEINEDALCLFYLLEPKPDIVVLGVGDAQTSSMVNRKLVAYMVNHKINVEVLPTEQACATFNFLNSEGRYIAGAIIPPMTLRPTDDDVLLTKMKHKKLLIGELED